jgi:uncharacterized protein (DUF362 family)
MRSGKINRREFIRRSTAIGVGSMLSTNLVPDIVLSNEVADLAVVKGTDYFNNTRKAVEILGGIEKFVPRNSKVALLPNPQSNNPGTYTKPEIVRAAIQMCKQAGAKEIACLGWLTERFWINTGIKKVVDSEGINLVLADHNDESQFTPVLVPKGTALKEARIMKRFYEYDLLINMNITKEHSGNNLSGALKNLMGLNSPASNQTFHKRDWTMIREDAGHLDQCIADLNTVIHPTLCIIDATEFIITNGPDGPGRLKKLQKVIAGTDPVAIDSYCSTQFGFDPEDIIAIKKAYTHGIGEMDLKRIKIRELVI